jgi:phage tail sheath protein FI
MANKVYASPGVYTSEKDLTFTTETIGVTTLGLVGETQKGPAFQPMFIKNYDQFKVTFGGQNPEKFRNTQIVKYELPYIANRYLTQSNQLFVTRVLGLSGYDAGMAYAIRTIGTIDQTTLAYTSTSYVRNFEVDVTTAAPGTFYVEGTATELIDEISALANVSTTKFDTAYYKFFNVGTFTNKDWYKNNVLYWGILDSTESAAITTERNAAGLTGFGPANPLFVDSYELPLGIPVSDRTNNILLNEFTYDETTDIYTGYAFAMYTYDVEATSASTYTGKTKIEVYEFEAEPNTKYHKKLAATLRSRGAYITDALGYHVDSTSIGFSQFDAAQTNPFATFDITGVTTGSTNFTYSVSLDKTKKNYIKNVLGKDTFDKDPFLFVEEVYDASLKKGWAFGEIKGLHYELLPINNWDHYKFQFQSPVTPFFVSELRGGLPQRLFRLVSISDGENANTEIKVSIANTDLDKKTFDLYIRAFGDSDKAPSILERFLGLSMDETSDSYVGRKIGTIDNKYPLVSSYVVVDIADKAPIDGVPAGFEGYEFRTYGTGLTEADYCGVTELPYKTKYYSAGELIVNPPYALPIYSNGDKIRKVYLGFTDTEYAFDSDLLKFKGKVSLTGDNMYNDGQDWSSKTKGFHMDINAASIVDANGNIAFATGVGSFTDPTLIASTPSHPYYDIRTRKFTALFSGGFDGWDSYREQRTNTDDYKIGRTGFVRSAFDTFVSVEYNDTFGTSDYYATLYGVKTYENPEQTSINILATPGIDMINNTELVRDTIEIVEEKRFDSIYLPTLPDIKLIGNTNAANSDDWFYPTDIIDLLSSTEIDSNYTAVYYPWIQISDVENNANLYIPPTAEVVRNLAFTDNVAHPWFATAGYTRGLVNCIRARIPLDQESRDSLYPGRINPIATFSDVGTVIWGNRNLQVRDSAMNRLNIRRLLLQARKLIVAVANRLLFDPNDAQVRSQFLSLVNPILDNIRKERGLTDFRVSLVNDVEDTDRNTLRGKIFIKPTPTLEFIELEFVVTPTSVSFDSL